MDFTKNSVILNISGSIKKNKIMTTQEWLDNNYSFYHVTQTNNIPSILKNGLQRRNPIGICVVRSNHPLIIEFITKNMLFADEFNFTIIEISPIQHRLEPNEIRNDKVTEITNPLHNYILRNNLIIEEQNIIDTYEIIPESIFNFQFLENQITEQKLINELDTF